MQALQDDGYEGSGSTASGETEGIQQGARVLIDSSYGLLSVGGVLSSVVNVREQQVQVIALKDVRVSDACALLVMQGMSAISALGALDYNNQLYLPIIADGFRPYEVPIRFARVVAGVPPEEPIPLEELVAAFSAGA